MMMMMMLVDKKAEEKEEGNKRQDLTDKRQPIERDPHLPDSLVS